MTARARPGSARAATTQPAWAAIGEEPAVAEAGDRLRRRILGDRRALGRRPPRLLGFAAERAWRRHPPPLDRAVQRRGRGPGRRSARGGARASPRRSATSACSPSSSSPAATGRWSTRSRRASTTAATGRSRARSPRSSSSTSARSAACRRARPASSRGGAVMDNLIGDEVDRWPELVAERGAAPPHLRQGRGAPRPQDGPRHAGRKRAACPGDRRALRR